MKAKRAQVATPRDVRVGRYSVAPVVIPGRERKQETPATGPGARRRPWVQSVYLTLLLGAAVAEVLALLGGSPRTPLSGMAPWVAAHLGLRATGPSEVHLVPLDANGTPEPPERWVAVHPVPLAHASLARLAQPTDSSASRAQARAGAARTGAPPAAPRASN